GPTDVGRLRALGPLHHLEVDVFALLQRTETIHDDGRMVDEDIPAALAGDEPVSLGIVKPLDLAVLHLRFARHSHNLLLMRPSVPIWSGDSGPCTGRRTL